MENNFIDLHIHPALKPLGKSFDRTPGVNSTRRNDPGSIWYYDPPTFKDKLINIAVSLTKFRQSDFTSLAYGGAHVVFVALSGLCTTMPLNFSAGISRNQHCTYS